MDGPTVRRVRPIAPGLSEERSYRHLDRGSGIEHGDDHRHAGATRATGYVTSKSVEAKLAVGAPDRSYFGGTQQSVDVFETSFVVLFIGEKEAKIGIA